MIRKLICLIAIISGLFCGVQAAELDRAAITQFIEEMVQQYEFSPAELEAAFRTAKRSERILKAMSRPAEKAKPWFEYRKHFLTAERIERGVEFWELNAQSLSAASEVYGVPPEIIVSIIGVETAYGRITGKDRVIDALSTLAFHYPKNNAKRMRYFREQLRHLFLLSREQGLDPVGLTGSYAGAMGIPQFMPESYRKFAVDFNDDGERNIWKDKTDAIGSVANYLKAHGWHRDKTIVVAAKPEAGADTRAYISKSVKPARAIGEFSKLGIVSNEADAEVLAALFELEGEVSPQYWFALNNFYVIMRYNPRTKYAMAVVQLAEAIRNARTQRLP